MPSEGSFDADAVRKAGRTIAEAGGIVATGERCVFIAEEKRRRGRREGFGGRPAE